MTDMGDKDLEIFDGLKGESSARASSEPGAPAVPTPEKQSTLLGMAPAPPPQKPGAPLPPPPPGARPSVPPPPPGARPSVPPPPPPATRPSAPPSQTKPPVEAGAGDLPPAPAPPWAAKGRNLDAPTPPPTTSKPGGSLPPPPAPPPGRKATASLPPPPLPGKARAKSPVDMDWDDDDEKTAVYDKGNEEDAAKALLRSAPPPAAGAPAEKPARKDKVGAAGAIASASGGAAAALPKTEPKTARPVPPPAPQEPSGGGKMLVIVAAVVAVVAVAAAVLFVLKPFGKANLAVTVAGPNNDAVDSVEIVIEDLNGNIVKQCEKAQCSATDLSPGMYIVRASAAGYAAPAPETLKLNAGDNPYRIVLAKAKRGTGIRVTAQGPGLRLSVDGHDEGPLPQSLTELKPGKYKIRIADEKGRYEPWEEEVEVQKDKIVPLSPKLKVLKGLAIIKPGKNALNARVHLQTGREKRLLSKLPIKVEITPGDPTPRLVAQKAGYHDFVRDISFDDGIAIKTYTLDLTEYGSPAPVARSTTPAGKSAKTDKPDEPDTSSAKPVETTPPTPATTAAPAAGQGRININSAPAATALVDGRPVGTTPTSWSGAPGQHTVLFMHKDYGRKSVVVNVKPGGTANAWVRFP